jgi:hypothetical protein
MKYIKIPLAYLPTENNEVEYDYDYMRIMFEKQLELLFHLQSGTKPESQNHINYNLTK